MVSQRTAQMTSFIVMDVLERACELESKGIDIVHLENIKEGLDRLQRYDGERYNSRQEC